MTYEAKNYWEEKGKTYRQEKEESPDADWTELSGLLAFLLKRLQPVTILELGCGYGKLLQLLMSLGILPTQITGFDISQSQLNQAKDFLGGASVELICGDFLTDLPQRKWDLGITRRTLIHVHPTQLATALSIMVERCKNSLIIESYVENTKQEGYWAHDYERFFKVLQIEYKILNNTGIERRYLVL